MGRTMTRTAPIYFGLRARLGGYFSLLIFSLFFLFFCPFVIFSAFGQPQNLCLKVHVKWPLLPLLLLSKMIQKGRFSLSVTALSFFLSFFHVWKLFSFFPSVVFSAQMIGYNIWWNDVVRRDNPCLSLAASSCSMPSASSLFLLFFF